MSPTPPSLSEELVHKNRIDNISYNQVVHKFYWVWSCVLFDFFLQKKDQLEEAETTVGDGKLTITDGGLFVNGLLRNPTYIATCRKKWDSLLI